MTDLPIDPPEETKTWEELFVEDYSIHDCVEIIRANIGNEVLVNMAYQIISEDEELQREIESNQ